MLPTIQEPFGWALRTGGGEKLFPYTFDEAKERLMPEWQRTAKQLKNLPALACPDGNTVIALTLHPTFLARSYYPNHLLQDLNLYAVGSRSRSIELEGAPNKLARDKKPFAAPELFVAGRRADLIRFAGSLLRWSPNSSTQDDFRKIEEVNGLDESRLKPVLGDDQELPIEVVLHASETRRDDFIVDGFKAYVKQAGINVDLDFRLYAGGLCFVPMRAPREALAFITAYSFVRVVRRLPKISLNESVLRSKNTPGRFSVRLPQKAAINADIRVAVFDGGLPETNNPLTAWVNSRDAAGVGKPTDGLRGHGLGVTSALLFGPLEKGKVAPTPYSKVDHWRVLDSSIRGDDFELVTVLRRIVDILRQRKYDFVCLSIGPALPIEDDDVHVWTSTLDTYLSAGETVLISACGNTGLDDWDSDNARVQPCADSVNGVGIGAAATRGPKWTRAPYSSIGPGRSPGFVKPDLVAFGGSENEPFWLLDHRRPGFSAGKMGTSYAAPYAARSGIGMRAHFGDQLSAAAIRALMVHHSSRGKNSQREVGWGRMPADVDQLVICPNGEVTVVFQGLLEPSQFIRFPIPVPNDPLRSKVMIKATFCFFTPVDPEDSLNYTRAGLGIVFRPDTSGHPGYNKQGKLRSAHASDGFFRSEGFYSTELERRKDAHKWETVVRAERSFSPGKLNKPVFDVEHHARLHGGPAGRRMDIRYSLIVSLSSENEPNLYNRVLQAYPNQLEIMQATVEVPISVRP